MNRIAFCKMTKGSSTIKLWYKVASRMSSVITIDVFSCVSIPTRYEVCFFHCRRIARYRDVIACSWLVAALNFIVDDIIDPRFIRAISTRRFSWLCAAREPHYRASPPKISYHGCIVCKIRLIRVTLHKSRKLFIRRRSRHSPWQTNKQTDPQTIGVDEIIRREKWDRSFERCDSARRIATWRTIWNIQLQATSS